MCCGVGVWVWSGGVLFSHVLLRLSGGAYTLHVWGGGAFLFL